MGADESAKACRATRDETFELKNLAIAQNPERWHQELNRVGKSLSRIFT
jgi:hypothetical protein